VPVNVEGTRNVLEVANELAVPRIVYTSTLAVNSDTRGLIVDETYTHNGPWLSEYDRTKWLAHYEVAEPMIRNGLPLVIVQPGMIYGPGDTGAMHRIFIQYLRGLWPIAPRQTAFCWGHVEDMARGHLLAMDRGRQGETYIIAGPAHTLIDAFETAERITGIRAPRVRPGPAFFRTMAPLIAAIEDYLPLPEAFRSESVRISAGATYLGRSDKARRELGFAPRSLEQGFRDWLPLELELLRARRRR
jgi:nucleoside-diphosphate-sugar epimerase